MCDLEGEKDGGVEIEELHGGWEGAGIIFWCGYVRREGITIEGVYRANGELNGTVDLQDLAFERSGWAILMQ